ncbi:MAG: hypothetical protein LBK92_01300 [Endomicrobium sp.]|nr:hypothetical protein [Endomicrobium sp.]
MLVSRADGCEPTAELTSDQQDSRIEPTPIITTPAATPTAVITNTLPPLHTTVSPSAVDSSAAEIEETQIIAATFAAATPTPTPTSVPTNQSEQGDNEGKAEL